MRKLRQTKGWVPPRGIRLLIVANRPERPYGVQWRVVDSFGIRKRRTKTFDTVEKQLAWAKDLAGRAEEFGVAAFQMDESEAREWRAFRSQIGDGVSLDAVLKCWRLHGIDRPKLSVRDAVAQFTAAKEAEGVARATLGHYKPAFARLLAVLGNQDVQAVTREQLDAWVAGIDGAPYTRRSYQKLVKNFFRWLKRNRIIGDDPCDGLKPVRIVKDNVCIYTIDEARALFYANESQPPELLGRLALEAFCGIRFSSAQPLSPSGIDFVSQGISIPANIIKTRKREYIDGLPDNLWFWLERSKPAEWKMTPRQYLDAKSRAVTRAKVRQIHNACRHGFGTYHTAAFKNPGLTAAIMCHTSQKMLWKHYKGRATQADGEAYFSIYPTGASCPVKQKDRPQPSPAQSPTV